MPRDYLKELNDEQRQVVENADGPCLVLAGAGSGKTRTIVYRVAYLIDKGVDPSSILLVTFTNKAAREMMERSALISGVDQRLRGGTFHHLANRYLRSSAQELGFSPSFTIIDEDDRRKLIKQSLKEFGAPPIELKSDVIAGMLSFAANRDVEPAEVAKERMSRISSFPQWLNDFGVFFKKRKQELNVMDFDDLLVYWRTSLEQGSGAMDRLKQQLQYVLVDEYQDVNRIQENIIRALTSVHKNLLAVGDDAQSIYGFRGAQVEHIRAFAGSYPQSKIFHLSSNYRSTPQIISIANRALFHHNTPYQKELRSERTGGESPLWRQPYDTEDEAQEVVSTIREKLRSGQGYTDIAVLFRSTAHALRTELALQHAGIPYVLRGGLRFFEQAHIKDMVAMAKILSIWQDELAWRRVAELFEGVGPAAADRIWQTASASSRSDFPEALRTLGTVGGRLQSLIELFAQSSGRLADALNWWLKHWYGQYLITHYDDASQRSEDCEAFCSYVAGFESTEELFAEIALSEKFQKDRAQEVLKDAVVLSTIHQAKGLEWKTVIIIGLTEGGFPHFRALENPKELEEERRLFYVAITRAKDHLVLLSPQQHPSGSFAMNSRFVIEMSDVLVDAQGGFTTETSIDLNADMGSGSILDRVLSVERSKRRR